MKKYRLPAAAMVITAMFITIAASGCKRADSQALNDRPRVIVTSDGEIDDECSMVRFLLYASEFEVEGIITSSSQYHWHGHNWAGDDWIDPYLEAYSEVYPNLVMHDADYPTPEYLKSVTFLGNVEAEGEMDSITPGSQHIAKVLLDRSDDRPVWIQAWGGTNTIARALKTIQEEHPEEMEYVAGKIRFFFIWEQDSTYQSYIRPSWGKYNILTIISDQFEAIAYRWKRIQPEEMQDYFTGTWMKEHILQDHGPLCALYRAHTGESEEFDEGNFRSEGDSPSFMHAIGTGLRNMESPDYGGWGGRYVQVRGNTWLDPVPVRGYTHPDGRWYGGSAWGMNKTREGATTETDSLYREYFKPVWRWSDAFQNDFAARADWCVKSVGEANHPPVVVLKNPLDIDANPGSTIRLSAEDTFDPDGDQLTYRWWQYGEADSYDRKIEIENAGSEGVSFQVPEDIDRNVTIHVICEVRDNGTPQLTRYQRVIIRVKPDRQLAFPSAEGYGKYSRGGRGGVVYEVTSLDDSGPGSLRAAVEASGPRTVVFRVSGTIILESPLRIENPYLTIAGQTAPGGGICLRKHPLIIDADHVIIRYLRVRPGDESGGDHDAVSGRFVKHIILDHISASWSVDECVSVYQCDSITVQWCMVSESLSRSNHIKGSHGYGGIWGSNYGTYHHNLLAHHSSRNPRMASGSGYTDYRNNVIYNWGFNSCYGGEGQQPGMEKFNFSEFNMVANYYKPGPATEPGEVSYRIANPSFRNGKDDFGRWYIAENVVEGHAKVTADNWDGGVQTDISADKIKREEPWPSMPVRQQKAEEAYELVLGQAGATLPARDAADRRIIEEVRGGYATFEGRSYEKEHRVADPARKCGIIDSQEDVGGWPVFESAAAPADTDHDGMPDAWEKAQGLDPGDPGDRNQAGEGGYTMLEVYLNQIR